MAHTLSELLTAMTSPDPTVRDGWAYEELAQGILSGQWDSSLPDIQATAIGYLEHSKIQARAFAPLILRWTIQAGAHNRSVFEACRRWYLGEKDTRGYDAQLGWLHAIAHGADCLAECASAGIATADEVLRVLAQRLVSSDSAWVQQEDARVVRAVIVVLLGSPDTLPDAWFECLNDAVTAYEQRAIQGSAPPVWVSNLQSVLSLSCVWASGPAIDELILSQNQRKVIQHESRKLLGILLPWFLRDSS